MSNFAKVFAVVGFLIVVVVLGIVLGFWGSSKSKVTSIPPQNEVPQSNTSTARPTTVTPRVENNNPKVAPSPVVPGPAAPPIVVATPTTNAIPDWEEKVDAILTSEVPDNEKAKKMLEMFPSLSAEAQEEVAHHLSNLVSDEDYAPLGNYLTNAALPEPVLDVLLEDVFNRPNSVKLPRLLDVARNPQHPKASESKDVLELFLEEDYGTDWAKWQTAMDAWLKDNPD